MIRPVRVLLEHPSSLMLLEHAEALTAAGFEVLSCLGPGGPTGRACPLVTGDRCDMVDQADVIINGLGPDHLAIYLIERVEGHRVCLLMDDENAGQLGNILEGVDVHPVMISGEELAQCLRDALAERPVEGERQAAATDR